MRSMQDRMRVRFVMRRPDLGDYMATLIWVKIVLSNGLVPDNTKPPTTWTNVVFSRL